MPHQVHAGSDILRTWLQTAAIFVALFIFLLREALEWRRRTSTRKTKLNALKFIIARECELNHWTVVSLRRQVNEIRGIAEPGSYIIATNSSGRSSLVKLNESGEEGGSTVLYPIYDDIIGKRLLDVAELDKKLAEKMEAALTGISEVRHVQESLISYVRGEDAMSRDPPEGFFANFADYATGEIDDARNAIDALYQSCTGTPLKSHRLR